MELETYRTQNEDLHEQLQQARTKLSTATVELESSLRDRNERENELVMMAARLQTLHDKLQTQTSMEYQHTEMTEKLDILKSQNKELEGDLEAAHGMMVLLAYLSPSYQYILSMHPINTLNRHADILTLLLSPLSLPPPFTTATSSLPPLPLLSSLPPRPLSGKLEAVSGELRKYMSERDRLTALAAKGVISLLAMTLL